MRVKLILPKKYVYRSFDLLFPGKHYLQRYSVALLTNCISQIVPSLLRPTSDKQSKENKATTLALFFSQSETFFWKRARRKNIHEASGRGHDRKMFYLSLAVSMAKAPISYFAPLLWLWDKFLERFLFLFWANFASNFQWEDFFCSAKKNTLIISSSSSRQWK